MESIQESKIMIFKIALVGSQEDISRFHNLLSTSSQIVKVSFILSNNKEEIAKSSHLSRLAHATEREIYFNHDNAHIIQSYLENNSVDLVFLLQGYHLSLPIHFIPSYGIFEINELNNFQELIFKFSLRLSENNSPKEILTLTTSRKEVKNMLGNICKELLFKFQKQNNQSFLKTSRKSSSDDYWRDYYRETKASYDFAEKEDYVAAFDVSIPSAPYIENCRNDFMRILPNDVKSIVDVGCGPGVFSRDISESIHLLGIDLDERILLNFPGSHIVGDIFDLPLEEKSTDLVLCCDVLEHLEESKINRAISELVRISKKYLYIQVPHEENLFFGMCKCKNCKNIWHINHHKISFNIEKLQKLFGEYCEVEKIIFTGERKNFDSCPQEYSDHLKDKGYDFFCETSVPCPVCSSLEKEIVSAEAKQEAYHYWLKSAAKSSKEFSYSEMAILFRKKTKIRDYINNSVSYSFANIPCVTTFSQFDSGPSLILNGVSLTTTKGNHLLTPMSSSLLQSQTWCVYMTLPININKGNGIYFKGDFSNLENFLMFGMKDGRDVELPFKKMENNKSLYVSVKENAVDSTHFRLVWKPNCEIQLQELIIKQA
jgi:SAM-dependent methyltransferase